MNCGWPGWSDCGSILGLRISRCTTSLLALLITFNVGGMLSLTQMKDIADGPMYIAVSTFLALTAVFYAAIIEDSPPTTLAHLQCLGIRGRDYLDARHSSGIFRFSGLRGLHPLRPQGPFKTPMSSARSSYPLPSISCTAS